MVCDDESEEAQAAYTHIARKAWLWGAALVLMFGVFTAALYVKRSHWKDVPATNSEPASLRSGAAR